MNSAHKPSGDDAWLDLVVALLAVNQYSVDKAYALAGDLRKTGLTDPRKLAKWSTTEIEAKLMAAGYERGAFMKALFSERLAALGRFVAERGLPECTEVISGKSSKAIERLLMSVKGVGPKVILNFCFLREISLQIYLSWHSVCSASYR